jgi:hypothetical protein
LSGRAHTFWVASLSSETLLRQSFTQALWQSTHPDRPDPGFTYATWLRAFKALADVATDQRHVVVLDEFPDLAHTEASVPSVLQQVWDTRLQHTRLVLILCSSHIGMMKQEVLLIEAHLEKSRKGFYQLRDYFLRFWFRFVLPHTSLLERGQTAPVLQQVTTDLSMFLGLAFEEICQEWMREYSPPAPWGFLPTRVGPGGNERQNLISWRLGRMLRSSASVNGRAVRWGRMSSMTSRGSPIHCCPRTAGRASSMSCSRGRASRRPLKRVRGTKGPASGPDAPVGARRDTIRGQNAMMTLPNVWACPERRGHVAFRGAIRPLCQ